VGRDGEKPVTDSTDTIDWQAIEYIDTWLDEFISPDYQSQPLAQDWGRTAKVIEELGEAIAKLILYTGQNPRKPCTDIRGTRSEFLGELADTALTAILCMQHFTKSSFATSQILHGKLEAIEFRAREDIARRQKEITLFPREAGTR
jgi:hypothetical protein